MRWKFRGVAMLECPDCGTQIEYEGEAEVIECTECSFSGPPPEEALESEDQQGITEEGSTASAESEAEGESSLEEEMATTGVIGILNDLLNPSARGIQTQWAFAAFGVFAVLLGATGIVNTTSFLTGSPSVGTITLSVMEILAGLVAIGIGGLCLRIGSSPVDDIHRGTGARLTQAAALSVLTVGMASITGAYVQDIGANTLIFGIMWVVAALTLLTGLQQWLRAEGGDRSQPGVLIVASAVILMLGSTILGNAPTYGVAPLGLQTVDGIAALLVAGAVASYDYLRRKKATHLAWGAAAAAALFFGIGEINEGVAFFSNQPWNTISIDDWRSTTTITLMTLGSGVRLVAGIMAILASANALYGQFAGMLPATAPAAESTESGDQ